MNEAEIFEPSADFARALRGFGPIGITAIVVILFGNILAAPLQPLGLFLPVSAIFVLVWAKLSRTPLRALGLVEPRSWLATIAAGILAGTAFKLIMKAVVMPLFGADPVNHAFHYLAGNSNALPLALVSIALSAGFGEELIFRGYMFERLRALFGERRRSTAAIVLITSAWFALGHYSLQGLSGVEQAAITGLAFGIAYAKTGRLVAIMIAHAAFDVTAVLLIYWNLEGAVAHAVIG